MRSSGNGVRLWVRTTARSRARYTGRRSAARAVRFEAVPGAGSPENPLLTWLKELQLLSYAGGTAVLGGLLYALIALAYDRFYRSFGVEPDDVGLTSASLVPRTAVALAIFAAIACATICLVALAALTAAWLLDKMRPKKKAVDRGTVILVALAMGALLAAWPIGWWIAPVVLATPAASLVAVGVACFTPLLTVWIRRRMPPRRRVAAVAFLWVGALAALFIAGAFFSYWRAGDLSRFVHAGNAIPPTGLTFVYDFHADPVCVSSTQEEGAFFKKPTYRLYLGEANDWVVLFDPETGTTNRVSSNGLLLTFLPIAGEEPDSRAPGSDRSRARCCD
jgi:MFS family permease